MSRPSMRVPHPPINSPASTFTIPTIFNRFSQSNRHALGNRARKSGQGILTVRFEMPFAIWCTTCPKPTIIGQGVRFNAEKKRVGNYHTTPIFSFRMKHVPCGGWIEIRTDPKNTAYVVTEGAKKRDTGEDKHQEGEIRIRTDEERERLQNDAFAALEGRVEDKRQTLTDKSRIEELQRAKEKDWEDPYAASKRLRGAFRVDRKVREKRVGVTEALKDRMSLGMDLLEENEEDRKRAGFVEFGAMDTSTAIGKATSRPLFAGAGKPKTAITKRDKVTKAMSDAEIKREQLRQELSNNTRAAMDPFLSLEKPLTLGVKREKTAEVSVAQPADGKGAAVVPLVDYDSD